MFGRLSRNYVDYRDNITIAFRGPILNHGNGHRRNGHDGNGCLTRQRRL